MKSSLEHWNSIFSETENAKLDWYEKDSAKIFELLNQIPKYDE